MAKKSFNVNKRSKPMSKVVDEFEGKAETVEAVQIFESNPTIENKERAVAAVKADPALTIASTQLLDEIQELFVKAFSVNSVPTVYSDLKREAKYLADLHQVSGLYMAQRLKVIRDQELYKEDGYLDFKAFIEGELSLSKRSVYNYIDIVEQFIECKHLHSEKDIETLSHNRSKLLAYMPLLKSEKLTEEDKDKLRGDVLKKVEKRSFRDLTKDAKELKYNYGLSIRPEDKAPKTKLTDSLINMFENIKGLSNPKANDAFFVVLEQLEVDGLISGKELGALANLFKSSK